LTAIPRSRVRPRHALPRSHRVRQLTRYEPGGAAAEQMRKKILDALCFPCHELCRRRAARPDLHAAAHRPCRGDRMTETPSNRLAAKPRCLAFPRPVAFVSTPCDGSALAATKAAAALSAVAAQCAEPARSTSRALRASQMSRSRDVRIWLHLHARRLSRNALLSRALLSRTALERARQALSAVSRSADKDRARARITA
jgi:hypothetical protein